MQNRNKVLGFFSLLCFWAVCWWVFFSFNSRAHAEEIRKSTALKFEQAQVPDSLLPLVDVYCDAHWIKRFGVLQTVQYSKERVSRGYSRGPDIEGDRITFEATFGGTNRTLSATWNPKFPSNAPLIQSWQNTDIVISDAFIPWIKGDKTIIVSLAINSAYAEIGCPAAAKLSDQELLARVAIEADNAKVRRFAADKLIDEELLGLVATKSNDPEVRRISELYVKSMKVNAVVPLEEWTNSIGMKFRLIPAGTFQMGSPEGESGHRSDEVQHQVTLSQPFWMGVTEVTQVQWAAVMETDSSGFRWPNRPVENVSWIDAVAFIEKLSALEPGITYRLPTESEWEYACRAGSTTIYYFGDNQDHLRHYAWYSLNSCSNTHGVGEKKPNRWGLYDMAGNVWEWCADWYGDYPTGPVTDPKGPVMGKNRVLRGGSWDYGDLGECCRSACRRGSTPDNRYSYRHGLRLVRTP